MNLVKQCAICLRIDNKEVKEAAFEAACDGLVAFGPQIAHNVGFERLITTPTQGKNLKSNSHLIYNIFKRFDTSNARIFGRIHFQASYWGLPSRWKSATYN